MSSFYPLLTKWMEKMMIQAQKLKISAEAVMNGFCWSYSNALLDRLEELARKDGVFVGGVKTAQKHLDNNVAGNICLTDIATSVTGALVSQLNLSRRYEHPDDITALLLVATEYLAIFKE